jgi:hypothetical protein
MKGEKISEFFPNEAKVHKLDVPGTIGKPKYPDTAEAIEAEQKGNVRLANADKASAMKRK